MCYKYSTIKIVTSSIDNHLSIFVLGSTLLFNSVVSKVGILLGSDLVDYSAVAAAALNI